MATAKHSSEQFIGEAQIIEFRVENRGFLGVFEGSRGCGLRQRAEKERFETSEDVFDGFFPRKNFARRETESMEPTVPRNKRWKLRRVPAFAARLRFVAIRSVPNSIKNSIGKWGMIRWNSMMIRWNSVRNRAIPMND